MANDENLKPIKPGETRNPNGRPKGHKNITTLVKALLEKKVELRGESPIGKAGDRKKWSEVIAARMVVEASKGNMKAMRELLDRTEGKVVQPIEGTGDNGEFKINITYGQKAK